ncbi:MAG: hypothetical protein AVDCRST_MAG77-1387 [uncultured Chloroflexi bacterium]|uniref:Uncharacterized protein n=1 Tax=uncultured Chloroflexota bacterium TaxID=166587 RepID=A0A6J4I290_9CHLR|nr:MAG: hypothetical protein AVDCRST_MAG77-1387 [uncultured Chloroflexota bacterium]
MVRYDTGMAATTEVTSHEAQHDAALASEPAQPQGDTTRRLPNGATGVYDPERAIQLLRSWREGDEEDLRDQRETGEFLRKALDEDRPGYRKFFL